MTDVVVAGPAGTVALTAPSGAVAGGAVVGGATATVALTAPPGSIDDNSSVLAGATALMTISAPAGVVATQRTVAVAGPRASTLVVAPVGDVGAYIVDRSGAVLTLALLTTEVRVQPGVLRVSVSNGDGGTAAYFFLDGGATPFASTVLTSAGSATVDLPINNVAIGGHTIRAGDSTVLPSATTYNERSFTVTGAPAPAGGTPTEQFPPMPDAAPVNYWVFQAYDFSDLQSISTYVLPVNPNQLEQGFGDFRIESEPTTVSSGTIVSWEGAPTPIIWRWGGVVLTEAQHADLLALGVTGQRVYLTDHFRRRYLVKIASLTFQRVRDVERPWHHSYDMTAWVLSGPGVST